MRFPDLEGISQNTLKSYFLSNGLSHIFDSNLTQKEDLIPPNLIDLYALHQAVLLNKRTKILEYGTGWSTYVLANALSSVSQKYFSDAALSSLTPFRYLVIDSEQEYIDISRSRLSDQDRIKVEFVKSNYLMTTFNDRICTKYDILPNYSPDLIYIDGPSQKGCKNNIRGFTTSDSSLMPMMSDILQIEHFLAPGTLIIVDGRAANARFLRTNLQRDWNYCYLENVDQHYFYQSEAPLGKKNAQQLQFYFN